MVSVLTTVLDVYRKVFRLFCWSQESRAQVPTHLYAMQYFAQVIAGHYERQGFTTASYIVCPIRR